MGRLWIYAVEALILGIFYTLGEKIIEEMFDEELSGEEDE